MKKTQIIDLFSTIKNTRASFIAISLFVAMAVALFTGLSWSIPGSTVSMDRSLEKRNAADIDIVCPLGLDNDDLETLSQDENVREVEGLYSTCLVFKRGEDSYQAKILSLTKTINIPFNVEGTLPEDNNQIAVEAYWAKAHDVAIGDTVVFNEENEGNETVSASYDSEKISSLKNQIFTVTALMEHPAYLSIMPYTYGANYSNSTPLDCLMFVSPEAFDKRAFGGFTEVYVTGPQFDGMSVFGDEYSQAVEEFAEDLEEIVGSFRNSMAGQTGITSSVFTLRENASITMMEAAKTSSNSLRLVMAALFTLVGLLVCFSAIRRLVYEQIIQIGTKKALGFRHSELLRFQLSYTGIALACGCIFGLLMGRFIIEPLVIFATKSSILFEEMVCVATVPEATLICAVEIIILLLITLLACAPLLKRNAIEQLAGEHPMQGKQRFYEKLPLWDRLSLLSKTIVNNCFNDPRRIFATIVGIMGCTALMVTSFTFLFNLKNSLTFQFEELFHFDSIIFVDTDVDGANERVEDIFDEYGVRYSPIHFSKLSVSLPDGTTSMSEVFVPLDDSFYNFVTLQNLDGETARLDQNLWLWAAAQNSSEVEVGDIIEVKDTLGASHKVTVEGVFPYYLCMQQSFITAEGYEREFNLDADKNAYLIESSQCDIQDLKRALNNTEGFYLFYDYRQASELCYNIMSTILYAMVGVFLVLSIIVAVLVIYNLLVMFINEKQRDLIVMMINGFGIKQAKRYIYMDTIFLSIIGSVLGCVLGDIAGELAIISLCNEIMYYLHEKVIIAWVVGAVLAGVALFVMTMVALKKIDRFKLTDINRF